MMISSIIRIHDKNNTKNSEISYDLDDDCQTDLQEDVVKLSDQTSENELVRLFNLSVLSIPKLHFF